MWEEQAAWPELLLWGKTAIAPGKKKVHLKSIGLKCVHDIIVTEKPQTIVGEVYSSHY